MEQRLAFDIDDGGTVFVEVARRRDRHRSSRMDRRSGGYGAGSLETSVEQVRVANAALTNALGSD